LTYFFTAFGAYTVFHDFTA